MTPAQRKAVILEFEQYLLMSSRFQKWTKEVVFSKIMNTKRQFRADYYIEPNILIEINGGQWSSGRHNRGGKGYENDLTKLNLAQANGFKVYQFTYEMLMRREYVDFI